MTTVDLPAEQIPAAGGGAEVDEAAGTRFGAGDVVRSVVRSLLTFVGVSVLLVGLWIGFLEFFEVSDYVGKRPGEVWDWFFDPAQAANRSQLWEATRQTLWESALGFLCGLGVAIVVAISFTLSRPIERAVLPIALALRSVPIVAMIPLLAYVFGRGTAGSLVIISIIVWFPALVLVSAGLRAVRPEALELLRVYDAGPVTQLIKVRLPSAIPSILASAKVCAPLAILGSLLNGWLSTGKGLGALMNFSTITAEYVKLWAAVVVVTVCSVVFAAVVSIFEQMAYARWAPDRMAV